jgi:hypothetical protein
VVAGQTNQGLHANTTTNNNIIILYLSVLPIGLRLGSRSNVLLYESLVTLNPLCARATGHPNATDSCVRKTTYRDRDLDRTTLNSVGMMITGSNKCGLTQLDNL